MKCLFASHATDLLIHPFLYDVLKYPSQDIFKVTLVVRDIVSKNNMKTRLVLFLICLL